MFEKEIIFFFFGSFFYLNLCMLVCHLVPFTFRLLKNVDAQSSVVLRASYTNKYQTYAKNRSLIIN